MGILSFLAQGNSAQAVVNQHCFYQNWGCAGVLTTLFVPFVTLFVYSISQRKKWISDFKSNLLFAKESVAAVFMETVIFEAQLLLKIIEDHLPDSITQASKPNPQKTKFDLFCERLVGLKTKPEENPRGVTSKYFGEIFSDLIINEAKKLAKIIELPNRLEKTDYNPTGISYALKGDTALKFSFIAERMFSLEKVNNKYHLYLNGHHYFTIISIIGFASFFVPLLWNKEFLSIWGYVSITIFCLSALFGFILWANAKNMEDNLNTLKEEYEENCEEAYGRWKTRNKK